MIAAALDSASLVRIRSDSPFPLENAAAYRQWRDEKLQAAAEAKDAGLVEIRDLGQPTAEETAALLEACRRSNMALYRAPALARDAAATRRALGAFARTLGMQDFEKHRSSGDDGIVPIEVTEAGGRAGFIPYSDRAINWHTDGYYAYRGPDRPIRSMVLHCVRNASAGGENALLDQDIAYIRLRDANPAFVEALMHPQAMAVPAFEDRAGPGHGMVAGPVFIADGDALTMRFTIRKRNVVWRDDPMLAAALQKLAEVLADDPLIVRRRLEPNEGIVCNNVLHNRTAFTDGGKAGSGRLLLRIRCYDRIGGEAGA